MFKRLKRYTRNARNEWNVARDTRRVVFCNTSKNKRQLVDTQTYEIYTRKQTIFSTSHYLHNPWIAAPFTQSS